MPTTKRGFGGLSPRRTAAWSFWNTLYSTTPTKSTKKMKKSNKVHMVTIELEQIIEIRVLGAKDNNEARRRAYQRLKRQSALKYAVRKNTDVVGYEIY